MRGKQKGKASVSEHEPIFIRFHSTLSFCPVLFDARGKWLCWWCSMVACLLLLLLFCYVCRYSSTSSTYTHYVLHMINECWFYNIFVILLVGTPQSNHTSQIICALSRFRLSMYIYLLYVLHWMRTCVCMCLCSILFSYAAKYEMCLCLFCAKVGWLFAEDHHRSSAMSGECVFMWLVRR